jgi:hypothetical protein
MMMCTRIRVAREVEDSSKKIAGDKVGEEKKVSQEQHQQVEDEDKRALQTRTAALQRRRHQGQYSNTVHANEFIWRRRTQRKLFSYWPSA